MSEKYRAQDFYDGWAHTDISTRITKYSGLLIEPDRKEIPISEELYMDIKERHWIWITVKEIEQQKKSR